VLLRAACCFFFNQSSARICEGLKQSAPLDTLIIKYENLLFLDAVLVLLNQKQYFAAIFLTSDMLISIMF
jgi:hypothetical protein